jgi:hypothetical protein
MVILPAAVLGSIGSKISLRGPNGALLDIKALAAAKKDEGAVKAKKEDGSTLEQPRRSAPVRIETVEVFKRRVDEEKKKEELSKIKAKRDAEAAERKRRDDEEKERRKREEDDRKREKDEKECRKREEEEEKKRANQRRLEEGRLEKERLKKERLEKERLEEERLEKERLEKERPQKEQLEKGRMEKERLEKEEVDRKERERREAEEKERQRKAAEEADRPVAGGACASGSGSIVSPSTGRYVLVSGPVNEGATPTPPLKETPLPASAMCSPELDTTGPSMVEHILELPAAAPLPAPAPAPAPLPLPQATTTQQAIFIKYDQLMVAAKAAGSGLSMQNVPWPVFTPSLKQYPLQNIAVTHLVDSKVMDFVNVYVRWKGWNINVEGKLVLADWVQLHVQVPERKPGGKACMKKVVSILHVLIRG